MTPDDLAEDAARTLRGECCERCQHCQVLTPSGAICVGAGGKFARRDCQWGVVSTSGWCKRWLEDLHEPMT